MPMVFCPKGFSPREKGHSWKVGAPFALASGYRSTWFFGHQRLEENASTMTRRRMILAAIAPLWWRKRRLFQFVFSRNRIHLIGLAGFRDALPLLRGGLLCVFLFRLFRFVLLGHLFLGFCGAHREILGSRKA